MPKRSIKDQLEDAMKRREMYLDLARQCDREIIDLERKIEKEKKK